jgi:Zn-dependent protease with chaperone function
MLTLAASILLCFLLLWLLFGALSCALYPLLRNTMASIDPAQASMLLLAWFAMPVVIAGLTCAVLYSPDVSAWLVTGHCHLGNCRQHGPQSAGAILPAVLLLLWTGLRFSGCLRSQWLPAHRLNRELAAVGRRRGDYIELDTAEAAAFTVGWWNPSVFITAGLRAACSSRELDCIVLHERGHRRRRDNVRLLVARLLSQPLPRTWSRAMLEDFKLCCEKASDQFAARAVAPEAVAAALLRVARLQTRGAVPGVLAFAGSHIERRVRALLAAPAAPLPGERVFACVAVGVLLILTIVNPLHRALELIP